MIDRIVLELASLLEANSFTLSVAESCTGGFIAHKLTSVSGASKYFLSGVVSYAVSAKEGLLGVDSRIIEDYGVVSEPVAADMARGVLQKSGSDFALSTTGFAQDASPRLWIGFAAKNMEGRVYTQAVYHEHNYGDRIDCIEGFSTFALDNLTQFIKSCLINCKPTL